LFRHSRVLSLSSSATSRRRLSLIVVRSQPFGKYCRKRPLVFSLVPRCQGECASAK